MSLLAALDALCALIGATDGVPSAVSDFAALISRARAERRNIRPDELAALQADDDELSKTLNAAIAAARSNA